MDVENTADRIVRIDVSKSRVDVHVRLDGTDHDRRARPQAPVILPRSGGHRC
jgi:hypothetical protein